MSLADAARIKNLLTEVATIGRRLDALEQYIAEVDIPDEPVPDFPGPVKRGPGRPRKAPHG